MVLKISVSDVPPFDGTYDIPADLTNREWYTLKRIADVTVVNFDDELRAGSFALYLGLLYIELTRQGRHPDLDQLWDAPGGSIIVTAEKAPTDPPAEAQKTPTSSTSSDSRTGTSGPDSVSGSESRESDPSPTGPPL